MVILIGIGYGFFRYRVEMLLIAASAMAGLIGARLGYSWSEMQAGIVESVAKAMPPTLIMIMVGVIIGSWIAAGTIPMLVYYGLKAIAPGWFLVTACLVCSIVSVVTGTSYGTAGTIGIAFIGIAQGMGIPVGMAAGAVVAGAYFGDKISPFSDTTNLASTVVRTNLFDHITHLQWTTAPAFLLGLIVYAVVGMRFAEAQISSTEIEVLLGGLESSFVFHWLLLLPPVIMFTLAVRRGPPLPGMLLSSVVAVVCAVGVQGVSLGSVLEACVVGYTSETGVARLDTLLSRGGMQTMMDVILVAFCAFAFAGIMQKTGMLVVILRQIGRIATTTGRLVSSAVSASIATAIITGSSYLSIIIPGELFAPAFRKAGLAAKNLSRTTEDSGTVVVPLVPWSMAGVFMAGTLGVPTLEYAPWAVMCYTGFLFALVYGFTGLALAPRVRDDETIPGS
jgi:NhaC family Na+:H+ antiporter